MTTDNINFKRQYFVLIAFISVFLVFSVNSFAQKGKEISFSFYPGITLVNFEKALDYSDNHLQDWSEFYYSFALRGFLLSDKPIKLGAELAWQRLYYAYYVIPYVPAPVHREFNISTVSIMALGRYTINNFFTVGGAGFHFFNDGVAPSICLEAGYLFNAGPTLKLPISFRINPVFGSGTPVPISVGAGVSYTFK
jgi:hypothetical protein